MVEDHGQMIDGPYARHLKRLREKCGQSWKRIGKLPSWRADRAVASYGGERFYDDGCGVTPKVAVTDEHREEARLRMRRYWQKESLARVTTPEDYS